MAAQNRWKSEFHAVLAFIFEFRTDVVAVMSAGLAKSTANRKMHRDRGSLTAAGNECKTSRLTARSPQERRHRHTVDQSKYRKQRKPGTCKPGFDLEASSRAVQAPFAEVLTVIG